MSRVRPLRKRAVRLLLAGDRLLYRLGARSTERMTLPDFLGLGPGQSGSTWLFSMLSHHPEVFIPADKELNYFDRGLHEQSLTSYARHFETPTPPSGGTEAGGGPRERDVRRGEITPGYAVLRRDRIAFVQRAVPDAKLLLTVRHPVDRAWSAARRYLGKLGATPESFGDRELTRLLLEEWMYVSPTGERLVGDYEPGVLEGHYSRIVQNWEERFGPDRLLVLFFGRIRHDPEGLLERVCVHIGVDPSFRWPPELLRRRVNPNPPMPLPDRYRALLEEKYRGEVDWLERRFGSSAGRWLRDPQE